MKFDISKKILIVIWVMVVINLFDVFPSGLEVTLNAFGVFLVVAHLGEYIFFRKTIAKREEGTLLAFVMTFFFDVLYWKDYPSSPLR